MQEILRQVAAGSITPEEAAARIAGLQHGPIAVAEEDVVRRLRVTGLIHPTRIVGDPEVKDAAVRGPHQATREGDTMVVRGMPMGEEGGWFSFRWPERLPFPGLPGENPLRPVLIRMNPSLELDVEMAAGLLTVQGVKGPIKADIQAGSAKVEGFSDSLDLSVKWGTVTASGVLRQGSSRVRCEAGTVKVRLERGSSVKVVARSTLGKISLPGDEAGLMGGWTMSGDVRECTVGDGVGHLEIEATTGAVFVEAD